MTTTRAFALHMLDRADALCALTHRIIGALDRPWGDWIVDPDHGLHEGHPELSGWRMLAACGNRDLPMLVALTEFVCSQGLRAVGVCIRFLIDTLGVAVGR